MTNEQNNITVLTVPMLDPHVPVEIRVSFAKAVYISLGMHAMSEPSSE